jgi:hypothetical protein
VKEAWKELFLKPFEVDAKNKNLLAYIWGLKNSNTDPQLKDFLNFWFARTLYLEKGEVRCSHVTRCPRLFLQREKVVVAQELDWKIQKNRRALAPGDDFLFFYITVFVKLGEHA